MIYDLKDHMNAKSIAHIKGETEKLKKMPMNEWFSLNDNSKIMRVPGFLVYNVKDKPLFSVPFKGVN